MGQVDSLSAYTNARKWKTCAWNFPRVREKPGHKSKILRTCASRSLRINSTGSFKGDIKRENTYREATKYLQNLKVIFFLFYNFRGMGPEGKSYARLSCQVRKQQQQRDFVVA